MPDLLILPHIVLLTSVELVLLLVLLPVIIILGLINAIPRHEFGGVEGAHVLLRHLLVLRLVLRFLVVERDVLRVRLVYFDSRR